MHGGIPQPVLKIIGKEIGDTPLDFRSLKLGQNIL